MLEVIQRLMTAKYIRHVVLLFLPFPLMLLHFLFDATARLRLTYRWRPWWPLDRRAVPRWRVSKEQQTVNRDTRKTDQESGNTTHCGFDRCCVEYSRLGEVCVCSCLRSRRVERNVAHCRIFLRKKIVSYAFGGVWLHFIGTWSRL